VILVFTAAIVGCGAIARLHASAINENEEISLISVADIVPDRSAKFAKEFGGMPFGSINEMLLSTKPDVVHICTPHFTHASLAIKALKSGCNVVLEKPLCISIGDIALIKEAEKESGKHLGIVLQNRYKETSQAAKKLIDSKDCGKVFGARGFVTWKRDENYYTLSGWRGKLETEGGGVMINQAIHTLDLMFWLIGDHKSVEGNVFNHHLKDAIEVEDTAEAYFDFGDGLTSIFYASTAHCDDSPTFLEIECEKYKIILEGENLIIKGYDGKITQFLTNGVNESQGKPCWGDYHKILIEDFYSCLKKGLKFPVDVNEGSRALKAILGLYESSAKRAKVEF